MDVVEQVQRLLASNVLVEAGRLGTEVIVHGWIYDLRDGLPRVLAVSRTTSGGSGTVKRLLMLVPVLALGSALSTGAQTTSDRALLLEISRIKAIDAHAHALPAGAGLDDEGNLDGYLSSLESPDPAMWRMDPHHPDYVLAWRALYGYKNGDMKRKHVVKLLEAKKAVIREKGDQYPAWVLDQAGIEMQLVFTSTNGPFTLGRGQTAPRFRWVPRADALVFPFDSDREGFKHLLARAGVERAPTTIVEYKARVLAATLERWKREGAVAVKFGLAYLRALDFADVSEDEAQKIYDSHARGEAPTAAAYKALQDHLFRFMASEAGRIGLVVCIHTGVGAGDYFNVSGSNPALLEPVFNDKSLRQTKFVIVHGGWPYDKEAGALLQKPNVYVDYSVQALLRSTAALATTLRAWLEWAPEKVMFGTDAYSDPSTPLGNWEEKEWVASRAGRDALASALTGMVRDGELTRDHALLIARMVLRENAMQLFGLGND